jgi:hypothetical protein
LDESDEITRLLTEIRDTQREHLAEYRRIAARAVELQERAVARQEQLARIYKGALLVSAVIVLGLVLLIAYVMNWI